MAVEFDKMHEFLWGEDFIFTGEVEERDGDTVDLAGYEVHFVIKSAPTVLDSAAEYAIDSTTDGDYFSFPTTNSYLVSIPSTEITALFDPDCPYWVKTWIERTVNTDVRVRFHVEDKVIFRSSLTK